MKFLKLLFIFVSINLGGHICNAEKLTLATLNPIDKLNAAIVEILQPIQNDRTNGFFKFTKLELGDTGVKELAFSSELKKIGKEYKDSVANIAINAEYLTVGVPIPTTNFDVNLYLKLLNIIPQEEVNEIGDSIEEMIVDFVKKMTKEYGDAATVVAKVVDKQTDDQKNLTKLSVLIDLKLDFEKLPANKPVEDEFLQGIHAEATISLYGLSGKLTFLSNPKYKGFAQGQRGLREWLAALLNGSEDEIAAIKEYVMMFDQLAEMSVK